MGVPVNASDNIQGSVADNLREDLKLLSTDEQQQYFDWLIGRVIDPPPVVRALTVNLARKINVTTGYLTAMNLTRMNRISDFMAKMEEIIFDPTYVQSLAIEDQVELYKEAQRVLSTSLDFARKFIYQNKDVTMEDETDEIYKMIQALPPDVLRRVRSVIEDAMKGAPTSERSEQGDATASE